MPRGGPPTNSYSLPSVYLAVPGSTILAVSHNSPLEDIADVLNDPWPTNIGGTGGTSIITSYDSLNSRGSDVPTASTVDLDAVTGANVHLTGTTTVNTISLTNGRAREVISDSAFTLTASANLIVDGSTTVNGTITAGMMILFIGGSAGVVYAMTGGSSSGSGSLYGYTTTATAAGTTTLTALSTYQQYFTGSTTQTVQLPVTSTLTLGFSFRIVNNSTGLVTVNSSGGNAIVILPPGSFTIVTCILLSGTTAASWSYTPPVYPQSWLTYPTATGTADALVLTPSVPLPALYDGAYITFTVSASPNATTTPTLAVSGLTAKNIRRIAGGTDAAIAVADLPAGSKQGAVYSTAANAAAGAWLLTTLTLATAAQTISPPAGSNLVPTVNNLYFPTGFVYGLTLTTNAGDATNDIDIAVGASRSGDDTANIVQASALTKQADVVWAVGTNAGMLDTGAVGNNRYALWSIKRLDTGVVDILSSLSFTAPTMPANYTVKTLIGEFTRAGGVNGSPLWYGPRRAVTGYAGITLATPVASTSGTAIDFTGIPAWAKRVTLMLSGVSTNGTSNFLAQVGDAGGIETTTYISGTVYVGGSNAGSTAGFISQLATAANTYSGVFILNLLTGNTWTGLWTLNRSDGVPIMGAGEKTLSATLDRIRLTMVNGTDAFDAGTINISYE